MPAATKSRARVPQSAKAADANNPAVAEAEAASLRRPDDMPGIWPLHALPRAKRAAVEEALADCVDQLEEMQETQAKVSAAQESGAEPNKGELLRMHARVQRTVDSIVEALALGAGSEDKVEEFRMWGAASDEETVFAAFAWYVGTLQPGEAAGSQ